MNHAIRVNELTKSFYSPFLRKKNLALNQLSFEVEKGKMVGFLGANGAGKTTTLKILLNLIKADSGSFEIVDKTKIGFLPERPYFYDYLTGIEFIDFCLKIFNIKKTESEILELFSKFNIQNAAKMQLRQYSKGMLQRVGLIQATVNNPELLILDEPMSGLDPDGRSAIINFMQQIHKAGATLFFSTHLISDIEKYCDEVVIIDKGKLIAHDKVKTLLEKHKSNSSLEEIFLKLKRGDV
ncbi:MAG: ABC transporter ATP-binding protein [Oligoflexia bacterium]|nr:ABC transporter ATP-binding protein [Oligoflexia bacterium]